MRIATFAAAILALAAPLLAAGEGRAGPFTYTVKPGGIAEDCVKLKSGQEREFAWTSDAPVDFNIHWHDADKVEYPVRMERQWKGRGNFIADRDQDYCWMWSAPKANGATVTGSFKPVK